MSVARKGLVLLCAPVVWLGCNSLLGIEDASFVPRDGGSDGNDDPTNDTDCKAASDRGTIVHAAELEVFDR